MELIIRKMTDGDWAKVSQIYYEGIQTNIATFEQETPMYDEWNKSHLQDFRYVCVLENEVIGWIALSFVSSRAVYSGVVELSVYIDKNCRNFNVGTRLLEHLIREVENQEIWTMQSSIIQENIASIRLHEKCGFRMVGYRENIAKDKHGVWHNTVLMERKIESKID